MTDPVRAGQCAPPPCNCPGLRIGALFDGDGMMDVTEGVRELLVMVNDQRAQISELKAKVAAADRMADCLLTVRDYVADTASGHLQYRNKGQLCEMAQSDLLLIDA